MKGAGPHLHVIGLQNHAALLRPEPLERQDEALERAFRAHMGWQRFHRRKGLAGMILRRGTVFARGSGIKAMTARNAAKTAQIRPISPDDRRRSRDHAGAS